VDAFRIYPHHLSYLNEIAGGPARGPEVFDESNIDWGQDLPALRAWQEKHPEAKPLRVFYYGTATPASYGIDAEPFDLSGAEQPSPGYYAVSAHYLVYFRKVSVLSGLDVDWLKKYTPADRAGYSIYVYHFPPSSTNRAGTTR
jgi:hypothetical protein